MQLKGRNVLRSVQHQSTDGITKVPATAQVPAPLAVALATLPDRAPQPAGRAATRNITPNGNAQHPMLAPKHPVAHGLPLHGPPPHGQNPRTMTPVATRTANWNAKGPGQKNVAVIASRAKVPGGMHQRLATNIRSRKL